MPELFSGWGLSSVISSSDQQSRPLFRTLQPLVLASASPRRHDLLKLMGLVFDVTASGAEEPHSTPGNAAELVKQWAREKAVCVAEQHVSHWILAADTVVVLDGEIFGKPLNSQEALFMLNRLNNREHEVLTGVCLWHQGRRFCQVESVVTRVRFKHLSLAEIRAYVASGEPLDKAGAYGIQGLGAFLVQAVYGSYTNVVGLPLCETLDLLTARGIVEPCCPA